MKGFGIASARAVLPAEADGTNLIAELTIPNASLVSFELVSHPVPLCRVV